MKEVFHVDIEVVHLDHNNINHHLITDHINSTHNSHDHDLEHNDHDHIYHNDENEITDLELDEKLVYSKNNSNTQNKANSVEVKSFTHSADDHTNDMKINTKYYIE